MLSFQRQIIFCLLLGLSALFLANTASAADAGFGERLFDRCLPCHTISQGGPHSLGPNLFGVIGRAAGAAEGYVYSPAMTNSGVTWTPENIALFLRDIDGSSPDSFIPGNRMFQPAPPTPDQVADMLAYMQTLR
ncbi:MAG: c-type cytochrome [Micropepsaceae bacterium]